LWLEEFNTFRHITIHEKEVMRVGELLKTLLETDLVYCNAFTFYADLYTFYITNYTSSAYHYVDPSISWCADFAVVHLFVLQRKTAHTNIIG